MDISTIILLAVVTVGLYMIKMSAVATQLNYLNYNPLEEKDPEFLKRLERDGPKKVLTDERRNWFLFKSAVPALTLIAVLWSAFVYSYEPGGGTVLTWSIAVFMSCKLTKFEAGIKAIL